MAATTFPLSPMNKFSETSDQANSPTASVGGVAVVVERLICRVWGMQSLLDM
jgi:hypothetical protein